MPFRTRGKKRYGSVKRRGLNLNLWKNRPDGKSAKGSTSSRAKSSLAVECSEETRRELAALVAGFRAQKKGKRAKNCASRPSKSPKSAAKVKMASSPLFQVEVTDATRQDLLAWVEKCNGKPVEVVEEWDVRPPFARGG